MAVVTASSVINTRSGFSTVASRAQSWATTHPKRVSMRQKAFGIWSETTWAEAWDEVITSAHGLLALGINVGDRVAIASEDRKEWVTADLATVAVRAITVGLYPTNPRAEVEHALNDSGAKILVAGDQEQVDKVLDQPAETSSSLEKIICIDNRGMARYDDPRLISWNDLLDLGRQHRADNPGAVEARMAAAEAGDVMTLAYTSGTGGPAKGAMLTNANAQFAIDVVVNSKERMPGGKLPGPNDQILTYLPLCHVAERLFSTWHMVGCGTVLNLAESPEALPANLREIQPTLFFAVPRIWERLHAGVLIRGADASPVKRFFLNRSLAAARWIGRRRVANLGRWSAPTRVAYAIGWVLVFRALRVRLGLRHCRYAASGTAPIAPEVLEFFIGIGLNVNEIYGLTETTSIATANLDGRMKLGTVGEPYAAIKDGFRIDPDSGEIQIRHDGVFAGYWGKPEQTAGALTEDGWLKTGDAGEWVDGTHVKIIDRIGDIITTTGGKNVSPSAIENSLKTSPFISEAMVIGDRRQHLTALIAIEMEAVGSWCQKHNIAYSSYRDLVAKDEVVRLVQQAVDVTNEKFAQVDGIKAFRLLPKELDHEDGELTATQKLKRAAVENSYRELVESMY